MELTEVERAAVKEKLRIERMLQRSCQWDRDNVTTLWSKPSVIRQKTEEITKKLADHGLWIGIYERMLGEE